MCGISFQPDQSFSCSPNDNFVMCLVGNPLKTDEEALIVMRLDPQDLKPTMSRFDVSLKVNT